MLHSGTVVGCMSLREAEDIEWILELTKVLTLISKNCV